jgi:hypothetical protein
MEMIFGIIVGVSLAASCGFRVFVPMLVMSVAVKAGQLELADGWSWIGGWPALITFSVASVTEVGGYYVPWLDNLLDTISTPAAVVAGTIATAACVSEMSPVFQWSLAIIAGGGVAGTVQSTTVLARGASTAATGGFGNFIVASFELLVSFVLSVLAVVVPIVAGVMLCVVAYFVVRSVLRRRATSAVALKT